MNNYIVQNVYELGVAFSEWFLVKAKTKKDALDKVYELYRHEFRRKDFKVFTLEEFYDNGEDIAVIH